jgi:hypothetical protein
MRTLIKLSSDSSLAEIGLDTYNQIRARAESGKPLSTSKWLVDSTKDWFCGTKLCDAKNCLYDLVAAETSDHQRLQKFNQLKELIAPGFRDRFVEIETTDGFALAIAMNAIDGNYLGFLTLCEFADRTRICNLDHIQKRIDVEIDAARHGSKGHKDMGQFVRGDAEAVFVVQGTCYTFCGDESALARAWEVTKLLVDTLGCTEEQLTSIFALAHQRMFRIVVDSALESNGGLLTESETNYHKGPSNQLRYTFHRRLDGHVELTGYSSLQSIAERAGKASIDRPVRLNLAPEPVVSFFLKIAPDGSANIASALFGKQP